MVTEKGIEANPLKTKVIVAPTSINEVQQLIGRITTLSRFISKSAEKSLTLFRTLRKVKNFEWDLDCQQAFEELEKYLAALPLLVKPSAGDTLYLNISTPSRRVKNQPPSEANFGQTRHVRKTGEVGGRVK
ncbi:UNVERIFIED_CONTAM: hypothetical protein Slati_2633500 [Sesamum latifolium]|uniref:Reverse transcriptase/retrotransposon-derived protein RNase H-like domain-containing protein n=1 Tax=Sesamum latifolium TaxID=2727402 RepID=A0AAW2VYE1_9LAMI